MPRSVVRHALVLLLLAAGSPLGAQTLRPRFGGGTLAPTVRGLGDITLVDIASNVAYAFGAGQKAVVKPEDEKALLSLFQDAARLARDSSAALASYLDLYAKAPAAVKEAAKNKVPWAVKTTTIVVAVDQALLKSALDAVQDPVIKSSIAVEAESIQRAVNGLRERTIVALYADGTVRDAVTGSGGKDNTAGTGSIGLAASFASGWQLTTSVAVASTVDSIKSGYGASVLLPGAGKGKLSTFVFEAFSPPIKRAWQVGVHGYVSGGNSTWVDSLARSRTAATLGAGIGVYRDFLCRCRLLDSDVGITLSAGWATRSIQGNVAQSDSVLDATVRTRDRFYNGPELGLALTIGSVKAGVQYYHMGKADKDVSIPSLTGGQLVVGISVSGAIVSGPLSPR